jgi:ribosomal protein L40E
MSREKVRMEEKGTKKGPEQKFCENCGATIDAKAVICPKCGVPLGPYKKLLEQREDASDRSRLVALLFVWFFGVLGIHRFYVNRVWSGILWLLTFGLFGVGVLVDLILIASGKFTDKWGKPLLVWTID